MPDSLKKQQEPTTHTVLSPFEMFSFLLLCISGPTDRWGQAPVATEIEARTSTYMHETSVERLHRELSFGSYGAEPTRLRHGDYRDSKTWAEEPGGR
jgi:hypothetical protein